MSLPTNDASPNRGPLLRRQALGRLVLAALVLAVLLELDRRFNVGDAFPLKGRRLTPMIAFLILATPVFPSGAVLVLGGLEGPAAGGQ